MLVVLQGKYYLVIEAASQLYRSGAPLRPWLYYLVSIYDGPDKMLGMVLFVMYSIHKGGDIMNHVKQFCTACWKMLQDVVSVKETYQNQQEEE